MESALFGPDFQAARARLDGVTDPEAQVARAIYESESAALGMLRGVSWFSPALRDVEREFETVRYQMQEARLSLLFAPIQSKARAVLREGPSHPLDVYESRRVSYAGPGGWVDGGRVRGVACTDPGRRTGRVTGMSSSRA